MKKYLYLALVIGFVSIFGVGSVFAGIIKLESGSLDFLKGESTVNLEYSYDGMRVSDLPEDEFVAQRVAEYNSKEPGRGDRWKQAWTDNRAGRYQPKFFELLNKQFSSRNSKLQFGTFKDAKYTLILKTTFTSCGYNVAIARYPARINAEVLFVETQIHSNVLATLSVTKAPGLDAMGFDYEIAARVEQAYAKAGKELGIFISKKIR